MIIPELIKLNFPIVRPDASTPNPIIGAKTPRTPVKKVWTDM